MFIQINLESDIPIYLQLKREIVRGIATRRLKPGDPLPSVRQMAEDLGINLHTVNKTYNLLRQDGFVIIHRQKGVVIADSQAAGVSEEYRKQLAAEIEPALTEAFCRGMDLEEWHKLSKEIYQHLLEQGGVSHERHH